jgi:hypothetical protein
MGIAYGKNVHWLNVPVYPLLSNTDGLRLSSTGASVDAQSEMYNRMYTTTAMLKLTFHDKHSINERTSDTSSEPSP